MLTSKKRRLIEGIPVGPFTKRLCFSHNVCVMPVCYSFIEDNTNFRSVRVRIDYDEAV